MKNKYFIPILFSFTTIFSSCSTDVELYADYKDVAIVYAILNPRADTNYVKITRAFCGSNDNPINANNVALIADSCNYPGKLDAHIIELKKTFGGPYEPTGRVFELDTVSIHNKEEGTFYAPDEKIYYTTERLNKNSNENSYKYQLIVIKPDHDTVTAQTSMVSDDEFSIATGSVYFQMFPTNTLNKLFFYADGASSLYEVGMQFNYREQLEGREMQQKHVSRSFGTRTLDQFIYIGGNLYCLEYSVNWLFNALENAIGGDTIVNPNHPNVVRHIDDFIISISAAGEDLYCYYIANQAQQYNPTGFVSIYSNINGGFGLFSSRTTIKRKAKLSSATKRELLAESSWGFVEH